MATLLYSESKADPKGAASFVSRLLHGVTAIHMLHLGSKSYAQHMALGDLYEGLQEQVDALAEEFQGCRGVLLQFSAEQFTVPSDAVSFVQTMYEFAEGNRALMGLESHIQNRVDEICQLLAKTLYKLKNLA